MQNKVIIASSVFASSCVILIILLVYLLRANRRKQPHSPRDIVKQTHIPPCLPYVLKSHQPQLSINNFSKLSEESESDLEQSKYGPEMEGFYRKSRRPLSRHISMDNLNTPPPVCKIKKISRQRNVSPSQKKALFKYSHRSRNISEPSPKRMRSMTVPTSPEIVGNCDSYDSDKNQLLVNDSEISKCPSLGEILVSLCHNPSEGKLTITIKTAKDLPEITKTGKIDPFIKIDVYDSGVIKYKKSTSTKHNTKEPSYEESFDFVVTQNKISQSSVVLRLYHRGRRASMLNKNTLVGVVFLGYQFELIDPHEFMLDHGARHWASIIERPHLTIEGWHPVQCLFT